LSGAGTERIGPYRLIRRLGMGGMGEVFLAYDDRLERPVAIKQIRREVAHDPVRRERLLREARAAARLSHPNIVQVYDILEAAPGDTAADSIGASIVMEYVPGRSVAELLRQGPLHLPSAVGLARQIAAGLAAAHAAGLVHRDLKGENVLVDGEGRARILDFGLAKPLDSNDSTLTELGAVLGTYRAMSPEQSRGEPADARSDLFSFGVLLYEILTGTSPFAGRTPIETLRRIDGEAPRPVTELRPEVPRELAALVHALLEKDPRRRPVNAARVARDLQTLALLPELADTEEIPPGSVPGASTLADAPTVVPLPRRPPEGREPWSDPEPASPSGRIVRPRSRRLAMALILVLAFAAAGSVLIGRSPLFPRQPLRIAVLRPTASGGSGLDLAASGTLVAELRGLLSLQGLTPIDPSQIGEVQGTAQAIARAVSADEVLMASVEGEHANGYLSLRRVRPDGTTLWAERVPVPLGSEDALLLANAVSAALRRAYSAYRLRPGTPDLEARTADYKEFIEIKQRVDTGQSSWAPELDRLDALLTTSPRFLDGHLLATTVATTLYQDTKKPAYLDRARASLQRARGLAPDHPPLLAVEIGLALMARDWNAADAALARLERVVPGDPIVALQRCRISQSRGNLEEAAAALTKLVASRPGWWDLVWLADLESRLGRIAAARRHLGQALELAPGNRWPLAKLGELELLYGDLRRAETIYRGLAASSPHRSYLTNLGLVHYLLGDYDGAVASYRRALELDPGHLTVTLNLADAELALHRTGDAEKHYGEVLTAVRRKAAGAPLQPGERTIEAQCLARLGKSREAVAVVLDVLDKHADDAEVAYQSALVFALTGESASALALAQKAVRLGIRPRWLATPGFERLRSDPAFQALLAKP
jgi:serine/threonine protein kinase/tetratricopeptide (TPR) repeat protein